ncbi:MAG: HisA/HisF-related TIM barrel protein [Gammaproteobacteria bacterium]
MACWRGIRRAAYAEDATRAEDRRLIVTADAFRIVPVIDLMRGLVVHARRGERAGYRPLQSCLCATPEAHAVCDALLALHPFGAIYVADLDAIQGHGNHAPLIDALARRHPGVEFWIDAGSTARTPMRANCVPVLGSESLPGAAMLPAPDARWILSLDFRGEAFMGPPELLDTAPSWPAAVLAMTLDRVGSALGPDLVRLRKLIRAAGTRRVFAAGGIRDDADLAAVAATGAAGVLVASAVHDGRLGVAALSRYVRGT